MALKKPEKPGINGSPVRPVSSQTEYLGAFSAITEFLCSTSWEDGSRREPGSLTLTVSSGRWAGKLKDTNRKAYAFLTAETLDGLLEALEGALAADTVEWREDKPFRPAGK